MSSRRTLALPVRAARLASTGALFAGLAATSVLGGCGQLTNPVQTDNYYQASDGVPVDMGSVTIRGLVIVSDAEGQPGTLVGSLVNSGADPAEVSVTTEGLSAPLLIAAPAYSSTSLSTAGQIVLPSVSVRPGDVLQLQIGTQSSGANVVEVPVLPAREYYAPYAPTATPTATPTDTPTG